LVGIDTPSDGVLFTNRDDLYVTSIIKIIRLPRLYCRNSLFI